MLKPVGGSPEIPSSSHAHRAKKQEKQVDFRQVAKNVSHVAKPILQDAPLIRQIEGKVLKTSKDGASKVFSKTPKPSPRDAG